MKLLTALFFVSTAILFLNNCDTTDPPIIPPPDLRKITLTFEDASCTEIWLRIKADSITLPVEIKLMQETIQQNITLTVKDSVLYIDSLNPNQTYNYQAILSTDTTIKSEKVNAQTLAPTSHNFTWQTFEFGQHSSSVLYDVAIIDENNIWAVGEIFMNDSLGNPDPKRYNAAFWNGTEWTVQRIPYFYQGQPFYNPIYSIYSFSNNDIWFCGNGVIRWNGSQYIPISIPTSVWGPYNMNKLWGTSSNDLYVVGNNGNIAHFNASAWTKIESGTTLNIYDIWGDINPKTNEYEIIALASNIYQGLDRAIIKIKNNSSELINDLGVSNTISGIWFKTGEKYILSTGGGLYQKSNLSENIWSKWFQGFTQYYIFKIRGNGLNDIVGAGGVGEIVHFNGLTMQSYFNETKLIGGNYYSISIKSNNVVSVGENYSRAIITWGKR
jgi:hypothetical protein